MIDKISQLIILLFISIYPLFFLPITQDQTEINKMILAIGIAMVLLILYSVKSVLKRKLTLRTGPFGLVLFIIASVYIISSFVRSPNLINTLITPLSTSTITIFFLLYLLSQNILNNKIASKIPLILIVDGVIISLIVILAGIKFIPDTFVFPSGNPLSTLIFLINILVLNLTYLIILAVKKRDSAPDINNNPLEDFLSSEYQEQKIDKEFFFSRFQNILKIILSIAFVVNLTGSAILVYRLMSGQKAIILPLKFGFLIFFEIFKSIPSILVGVGPTNFITAFTQVKPLEINQTQFWNLTFTSSSSFFLTMVTETGFITLLCLFYILIRSLLLLKDKSAQMRIMPITISLLFSFFLQLILPSTMTVYGMTIFLMMAVFGKKSILEMKLNKIGSFIILISTSVLVAFLAYMTSNFYRAEIYFKKSYDAFTNNQGKPFYDYQKKALSLNPYSDRYHLSFSQTSLILANSLSSKKDIGVEERELIPQLIQQSINEAKTAVALNKTSILNWDNLSNTYAQMEVLKGSENWAVETGKQRILLDPNNPNTYLNVGLLYYNQKKHEEAKSLFLKAIDLKNDFAYPYFYLSQIFKDEKNHQSALDYIQKAINYIPQDSADRQKFDIELEEIRKLIF